MNRLVGHALILAASASGACVALELIAAAGPHAQMSTAVIGTPAARPVAEPAPPKPYVNPIILSGSPMDREQLARSLQRELRRVGCYGGDINGAWGPQSRQAMTRFTDRMKVRLPVDAPDHVLLKLVQDQPQRVCVSADATPPARQVAAPLPEVQTPPSAEPRLIAPPTEAKRPPAKRPADGSRPGREEIADTEPSTRRNGSMIPRAGVYSAPPQQTGSVPAAPTKLMRSLMQGVASALSNFELP